MPLEIFRRYFQSTFTTLDYFRGYLAGKIADQD